MFRLFEIINQKRREVLEKNGFYTVHELGVYQMEYSSELINSDIIFIEDEHVNRKYINEVTNKFICTSPFRFFENYFGFATISINMENFQLNILGEKFDIKEIEEIILYLFEKNNLTISRFISKSSISGSNVYDGKEYVYSSKYLRFIETFCKTFEGQYFTFKKIPHTIIRRNFKLANYNTQAIDFKSIEWVLQNLDSITFHNSNINHPDSVIISRNYGLIEKIGAEENIISPNNYENQIILGAFKYVELKLLEIKNIINSKIINKEEDNNYEYSQYSDFRDLQIIPFLKLLKEVQSLEKRLKKIYSLYMLIFYKVKPRNQFPKLTPVFYKSRHYQTAFNQIRLLRKLEYNLDGEIQLLNLKKLSELYELYNLNVIIDILDEWFIPRQFIKKYFLNDDSNSIDKISYINKSNNFALNIYYEPKINHNSEGIDLITIGNSKLIDRHCKPDFVLEIIADQKKRYCIMDSKYSRIETVANTHLTSCIKKYIIDIGIRNNSYQKPDYLVMLHPDSSDSQFDYIYSIGHFPKIKTIISKPKSKETLKILIIDFLTSDDFAFTG